MVSKEEVIEALKLVDDPELNIDVWTLGLIYEINIAEDSTINILMTFTTPLCPYGPQLQEDIMVRLSSLSDKVTIKVTFEPMWKPSDELRSLLGV